MSEETKTPPSSIAACYDTRADEARAILFPEAQGGISDDAYYNLMGLQYDMEHATPKDEVGIRTIKRVLDQLNRASNVLARKPVSAIQRTDIEVVGIFIQRDGKWIEIEDRDMDNEPDACFLYREAHASDRTTSHG